MAESLATELEAAIADTGLLLVELEKFRVAPASPVAALRAEALALGDRARRLHRTGTLDDAAVASLVRRGTRPGRAPAASAPGRPRRAGLSRRRRGAPRRAISPSSPPCCRSSWSAWSTSPRHPSLFHPVTLAATQPAATAADVAAEVANLRDHGPGRLGRCDGAGQRSGASRRATSRRPAGRRPDRAPLRAGRPSARGLPPARHRRAPGPRPAATVAVHRGAAGHPRSRRAGRDLASTIRAIAPSCSMPSGVSRFRSTAPRCPRHP